jgi:hypothetical protein
MTLHDTIIKKLQLPEQLTCNDTANISFILFILGNSCDWNEEGQIYSFDSTLTLMDRVKNKVTHDITNEDFIDIMEDSLITYIPDNVKDTDIQILTNFLKIYYKTITNEEYICNTDLDVRKNHDILVKKCLTASKNQEMKAEEVRRKQALDNGWTNEKVEDMSNRILRAMGM